MLVETTIDDPGVSSTLSEISKLERPANRVLAEAARKLGDNFSLPINADGDKVFWFPKSRNPQFAYQLYSQLPKGFLGRANEILLQDLAASNLPPGLSECELEAQVRTLLCQIPLAEALLNSTEDIRLTRSDALSHLNSFTDKEFTTYDLWSAFINWMTYFFPNEVMQQQITEIALRRARKLQ